MVVRALTGRGFWLAAAFVAASLYAYLSRRAERRRLSKLMQQRKALAGLPNQGDPAGATGVSRVELREVLRAALEKATGASLPELHDSDRVRGELGLSGRQVRELLDDLEATLDCDLLDSRAAGRLTVGELFAVLERRTRR